MNAAYGAALDSTGKYRSELENLQKSIPGAYFEFERLAALVSEGNVNAFDDAAQASLKYRQILESTNADAQIDHIKDLIKLETDAIKKSELGFQLGQAQREKQKLSFEQNIQTVEQYRNSLAGLEERLNKLRAGDVGETTGVRYAAQQSIAREQNALVEENIALQLKIAAVSENSADRYQNAWLRAIYEVKDANIQAIESQIASQVKLAQQTEVSFNQISAKVKEHLANQLSYNDAISNGIISIYDKAASSIDKILDKSGIGKIPILGDLAKAQSRNILSNITSGLLNKFGGSEMTKTGNPIVDNISKTNKILEQIRDGKSGVGGSIVNVLNGSGGGGANINTGSIFGGSAGGGIFNFGGGNSASRVFEAGTRPRIVQNGDVIGGIQQVMGGGGSGGNKGFGGILGNIKNIFSNKEGGIFAPVAARGGGTSAAGGYLSGAGQIATVAGGLIGGRVGSFISNIGSGVATGAQIGAMFGGPLGAGIGAAIGGGVGLVQSILAGDPKRKADKKQLPQLNQGFADALAQLRQLTADVKAQRTDGSSAIGKADELRAQIASGFGLNWSSKKYQKESASQIKAKLTEADSLIAELRRAADVSNAAQSRQNRLIPEFANGMFFGADNQFRDMQKSLDTRRGYINGGQIGVDRHLGLFADGEAILNKRHQQNIRQAAGFDVLAHAGIPNYPKAAPIKKYADGNFFGSAPFASANASAVNVSVEPVIEIYISENDISEVVYKANKSDAGRRILTSIIRKEAKERNI